MIIFGTLGLFVRHIPISSGELAFCRAVLVAILSYINRLVAVVVSAVFLREGITLLQMVGGLLILGFAVLNEKS